MMQHKTNLAPKLYSPTSIITTDGGGGGMFARSLSFSSSDASSDEKSHDGGGRVTTPKSTATFPTRRNTSSQRPLIEFTFEKSSTNTNRNGTNTNNRIITIPDRLFVPTLWINLFRCAEKTVHHHHGRARWLPHWWRRRHVCATSPTTPKSTATSSFLPILTLDLFGASRTSWTANDGRKQWRLQYIIDALNTCKLPVPIIPYNETHKNYTVIATQLRHASKGLILEEVEVEAAWSDWKEKELIDIHYFDTS